MNADSFSSGFSQEGLEGCELVFRFTHTVHCASSYNFHFRFLLPFNIYFPHYFFGLFHNSCIYFCFGMVGKYALGFQHLPLFCNLYFLKIVWLFVFLLCCNPKLHKWLFLPLGYTVRKHLDFTYLLISSFPFFHQRTRGLKRTSRRGPPKALSSPCDLWLVSHLFFLAWVSLSESSWAIREGPQNRLHGGNKIPGRK